LGQGFKVNKKYDYKKKWIAEHGFERLHDVWLNNNRRQWLGDSKFLEQR
jgi:hypothetical protein